jgi:hypothetical protein
MSRKTALAAIAMILLAPGVAPAQEPRYEKRWFYAPFNLLVNEQADKAIALIERAGKAGYNGVLLADYKFNILDRMGPEYFRNVERVKQAAAKAKVEIIPAVFPIGYSEGLLAHDPNLAEGLPVEVAPFVVKGREAHLVPDPKTTLGNGDLEETRGDVFVGFGYQDDPGKASFADREVVHHGKVSCRMQDVAKTSSTGNCRLIQRVKVRPHACYRFSAWVKTKDLSTPGSFHLTVLGAAEGGRSLTFHEGGIEPTMDWKRADIVFNSLDENEVNVYVGLWGGGTGTVWVDELKLEELGLVNVLRRGGCPLTVTSDDGKTAYEEGRDFETVRDPQLGQVPWAGEFSFDHPGPAITLTARSRIKDGARLKVGWYHPILTQGTQVMCCLSEPKVYEILEDQARRVNDLFHPSTFFMSHDEIRVANWYQACRSRKRTPGALLADNVRRCSEILKSVAPTAKAVTWSDMFDPNHNAIDHYYLVNGTLASSWEGLTPGMLIANWHSGKASASLKFFADRGHPQVIAGYYDDAMESFTAWDTAARGVPNVVGFMYTTWQTKYDHLEAYGKAMRRK